MGRRALLLLFARGVEHVVDPLEVAAEELELQRAGDQRRQRPEERRRQRVGRQHLAQAELAAQDREGAEGQEAERRQRLEGAPGGVHAGAERAAPQRHVELRDVEVEPGAELLPLGAGALEALDAADELDQRALGARLRLQVLDHELAVAAARQEEHRGVQPGQEQDQHAEPRAQAEDDDRVEQDEAAVEQAGQRARGEDLAHGRVAADPQQEVAGRPGLEERVRQADQVLEEADRHAGVEPGPQVQEQVGADHLGQRVEADQHHDAEPGDQEQVAIAARHHLVDHHAGQERQREGEHAEEERHHHRTGERRPLGAELAGQPAQPAAPAPRARLEAAGRLQHQGDAGEGAVELRRAHQARAARRIHDARAAAADPVEHDEVAEAPVQDRAARQEREVARLDPQGAAGQAVALAGGEDGARGDAVARDAHVAAQLGQRHLLAVVGQHHGEAGGAAVGPLHLLHVRHRRPARRGAGERGERAAQPGEQRARHQPSPAPGQSAASSRREPTRTSPAPIMPS